MRAEGEGQGCWPCLLGGGNREARICMYATRTAQFQRIVPLQIMIKKTLVHSASLVRASSPLLATHASKPLHKYVRNGIAVFLLYVSGRTRHRPHLRFRRLSNAGHLPWVEQLVHKSPLSEGTVNQSPNLSIYGVKPFRFYAASVIICFERLPYRCKRRLAHVARTGVDMILCFGRFMLRLCISRGGVYHWSC